MTTTWKIGYDNAVWTIPLGDQTARSQRRLQRLFRWICAEAAARQPCARITADNFEYIQEPLQQIAFGRRIKGSVTSRWILQYVIAYEDCSPTMSVGFPLLRLAGYLGDESASEGPFRVSIPQAVEMLSSIMDHEIPLFGHKSENGRFWLVSTKRGTKAMGVRVRIEMGELPSVEEVQEAGSIADWCARDRQAGRDRLVRRQIEKGVDRGGRKSLKRSAGCRSQNRSSVEAEETAPDVPPAAAAAGL